MNPYKLKNESDLTLRDYKHFLNSHKSGFASETLRRLRKIKELRERTLIKREERFV